MRTIRTCAAAVLVLMVLAGCGSEPAQPAAEEPESSETATAEPEPTPEPQESEAPAESGAFPASAPGQELAELGDLAKMCALIDRGVAGKQVTGEPIGNDRYYEPGESAMGATYPDHTCLLSGRKGEVFVTGIVEQQRLESVREKGVNNLEQVPCKLLDDRDGYDQVGLCATPDGDSLYRALRLGADDALMCSVLRGGNARAVTRAGRAVCSDLLDQLT